MTRVSAPTGNLSDLDVTILRYAAEGLTVEATARRLGTTMPAVQDTRYRLMGKLGATSLVNAVHLAYQAGILRRERHGDHPGFRAHERRGEDPWACALGCPEGERAYRAEMRRKRRQEPAGGPESRLEAVDGLGEPGDAHRAARGRTEPRGEAAA